MYPVIRVEPLAEAGDPLLSPAHVQHRGRDCHAYRRALDRCCSSLGKRRRDRDHLASRVFLPHLAGEGFTSGAAFFNR